MVTADGNAPIVIDGYVRLSRDDNKRSYSSIENQKKIIRKYADEHQMIVRRIYEDDGISGYSFHRPEFQNMMGDLASIDVIAAKDLSRIGRHNARVLLFLEEMEALGKRVILIDDHYDSLYSDDEIIGIKTWDNERHVKSTSRKVRRIKEMEQKNGTLISRPPFGYTRHPLNKQLILIDEEAAAILELEKELYLSGCGIRKTADLLTERGVPTPSMIEKEHFEALGLVYKKQVAYRWSFGMVKDTLFNDYNNGILRTHKRERTAINGKDKKVPADQQYVFPNHHPKIFDDDTVRLLNEVKESRHHSRYRGQKKHINLFSGCLYCADCGRKLTAINRPGREKYYLCGTYNKKGKQFCSSSHLVTEETLKDALIHYLTLCRDQLAPVLSACDVSKLKSDCHTPADGRQRMEAELTRLKAELKLLIAQKVKEMAAEPSSEELLREAYETLQAEKMERIGTIKKTLSKLTQAARAPVSSGSVVSDPVVSGSVVSGSVVSGSVVSDSAKSEFTALEVLNEVLSNRAVRRRDIEILVDKIVVDHQGNLDIYLKHRMKCSSCCGGPAVCLR